MHGRLIEIATSVVAIVAIQAENCAIALNAEM